MEQKGFFDENNRLWELSKLGDSLKKLNEYIAWENIREALNKALQKEHKGLWSTWWEQQHRYDKNKTHNWASR